MIAWSHDKPNDPDVLASLDRSQEHGFYSLLFLTQALGEHLVTGRVHIQVVTNDLFAVLNARWRHRPVLRAVKNQSQRKDGQRDEGTKVSEGESGDCKTAMPPRGHARIPTGWQ